MNKMAGVRVPCLMCTMDHRLGASPSLPAEKNILIGKKYIYQFYKQVSY